MIDIMNTYHIRCFTILRVPIKDLRDLSYQPISPQLCQSLASGARKEKAGIKSYQTSRRLTRIYESCTGIMQNLCFKLDRAAGR